MWSCASEFSMQTSSHENNSHENKQLFKIYAAFGNLAITMLLYLIHMTWYWHRSYLHLVTFAIMSIEFPWNNHWIFPYAFRWVRRWRKPNNIHNTCLSGIRMEILIEAVPLRMKSKSDKINIHPSEPLLLGIISHYVASWQTITKCIQNTRICETVEKLWQEHIYTIIGVIPMLAKLKNCIVWFISYIVDSFTQDVCTRKAQLIKAGAF